MTNNNKDDQLRDEESEQQAPSPHNTGTKAVLQRKEEALAKRVNRHYSVCLLLLIVVVIAAMVYGVCGAGKCAGSDKTIDPVRAAAIAAYVNNITLTNKTIAYPPVSVTGSVVAAEELALQWLIESDPLTLTAASSDQFRLQQRYALAAFWFETTRNGHVWKNATGWLTAENECSWIGINCTDVVGVGGTSAGDVQSVVEGIVLFNNSIHGRIAVDLGLSLNLNIIDLAYNLLTGSLPESIGQWTELETFRVSFNRLSGSLPESIGQWSNLVIFDIKYNDRFVGDFTAGFTGTLPESIGNWSNLKHLGLSENSFTGSLPLSIGQWTALTGFAIATNSFNGTLPASIGNWSKLDFFSVARNALTGTIPKSIENWNWKNVTSAWFDQNNFSGTMPTGICNAENDWLVADCSLNCTCCRNCYYP
jgi:Leucine-rich repeat (LRR) protein